MAASKMSCYSGHCSSTSTAACRRSSTAASRMSCSSGRCSSSSTAACQVMGVIDLLWKTAEYQKKKKKRPISSVDQYSHGSPGGRIILRIVTGGGVMCYDRPAVIAVMFHYCYTVIMNDTGNLSVVTSAAKYQRGVRKFHGAVEWSPWLIECI